MPMAVIRGAGKHKFAKRSKHSSRRKYMVKRGGGRPQKGGAIYSFDLTDKIGGQAARMSLYKTTDSDCPSGGVNDPSLGFDYYDPLKSHSGGGAKPKRQSGAGCGGCKTSTLTPKNNLTSQRGGSRKNQSKKHGKRSSVRKTRKH